MESNPVFFTNQKWELVIVTIVIKNGRHYLGKMDVVCGYCGGKGFQAEIQGYFINSDGKKLSHFGSLCCCEGHVTKSIKTYNLPE